jgi:hypothetical protein
MRAAILSWMHVCRSVAHGLGPYTLAAVLIPGGTVVALLWWLYRRHRKDPGAAARAHQGAPARSPMPAQSTPTSYSPAIANAKAWLGDRYLLAQPIYPPRQRRVARAFGRPRGVPTPPQPSGAVRAAEPAPRVWPADAIPQGTRALFAVAPRRERTDVERA